MFACKKVQRGTFASSSQRSCFMLILSFIVPQPLFPSLPLSLRLHQNVPSSGIRNFTDITVEQMAPVHPPFSVSTFLHVLSLFLSLSFSLIHSDFVCVFRFVISLSLSLIVFCLFLSFFNSFSDRLSSHLALYLTPRSLLSYVFDDLARVARSSQENLHSSLPPPISKPGPYVFLKTMTYSHSQPTCRIIRNSPVKTRIVAASLASTGLK